MECPTHGAQTGPLGCRHVLGASFEMPAEVPAVNPDAVKILRIDVLDDGSHFVHVALCGSCATKFGRANGEVLPGRYVEDKEAFPYLCPMCNVCLERWHGKRTPDW